MTRFAAQARWLAQLCVLWLIDVQQLLAHDCSGPDDCQAVPDNVAKTTAVVSTAVAASLANRILRNGTKKPLPDDWGLDDKKPEIDYEKLYGEEVGAEPPPAPAEPTPSRRTPGPPPDGPLGR